MTKLHLKYVQGFVAGGHRYHFFRRAGWPRIPLPGVVGSTEFMEAYQQALATTPVAIGVSKRSKPGSVSAAIAEFYGSQSFRSLTGGSPVKRRQILEHSASNTATCRSGRCRKNSSLRCSTRSHRTRHSIG